MNPQFQQMLQEATRLTRAGRLNEATQMIQHALRGQPDEKCRGVDAGLRSEADEASAGLTVGLHRDHEHRVVE